MAIKDIVVNRKAYHDYFIEEKEEAGIALKGTEIKSLRQGKASFQDAFLTFVSGEAFLKGLHISAYKFGNRNNHDEERERKLLLHRAEITRFQSKAKLQGYTLIPLRLYFKNGLVKVEIALARGKQLYDKREDAKIRAMKRDAEKALRR